MSPPARPIFRDRTRIVPRPPFATTARSLRAAACLILNYEMETAYGKPSGYHASV